MAQSAGVQDVLNAYCMTGQTSGQPQCQGGGAPTGAGQPGGGVTTGGSQPSPGTATATNWSADFYNRCVADFYNSALGKAVELASPGSMLWGPNRVEQAKLTGEAIVVKWGGLWALANGGSTSIQTLSGATEVSGPVMGFVEKVGAWAADKTLQLLGKAGPIVMGAATLADINAHAACSPQPPPSPVPLW